MTFEVSQAFNEARLQGILAFLGASARLFVYGGVKPTAGAATSATVLAMVELASPAGTISGGWLTFAAANPSDMLASASGVATWGRLVNGSGQWCGDFTISGPSGSGDFKLSVTDQLPGEADTQLWQGGRFVLGMTRLK